MNSYIYIDGWKSNIRFSSAHIIPEYEKCGQLHGHTYAVHIKVAGEPDKKGIIMDFSLLKDFVGSLMELGEGRHAFEFRNDSWLKDRIFELLAEKGMTAVRADGPGFDEGIPDIFPFVYLRRHSPPPQYKGCYPKEYLEADAKRITSWLDQEKTVFLYFNNDLKGFAVRNALELCKLLGEKN